MHVMMVGNTASRTAEFKAGTFAVVKTSENLTYDLTLGVSTAITGSAGEENVSFTSANALTHASFDHKNGVVYKATSDGSAIAGAYSGNNITAGNLQAATLSDPAGVVYAAATWQVDFTLSYTSASRSVALFIDWDKTGMAVPVTLAQGQKINIDERAIYYTDALLTESTKVTFVDDFDDGDDETHLHEISEEEAKTYYVAPTATGKGFRIAFFPLNADSEGADANYSVSKVLAKNETFANSHYLSGLDADDEIPTSGENFKDYVANDHDLLYGYGNTGNGDMPTTAINLATAQTKNTFLGLFPYTAGESVTLSYLCVAWYEGTDPFVINQNADEGYEKIETVLSFEAIDLAQ